MDRRLASLSAIRRRRRLSKPIDLREASGPQRRQDVQGVCRRSASKQLRHRHGTDDDGPKALVARRVETAAYLSLPTLREDGCAALIGTVEKRYAALGAKLLADSVCARVAGWQHHERCRLCRRCKLHARAERHAGIAGAQASRRRLPFLLSRRLRGDSRSPAPLLSRRSSLRSCTGELLGHWCTPLRPLDRAGSRAAKNQRLAQPRRRKARGLDSRVRT